MPEIQLVASKDLAEPEFGTETLTLDDRIRAERLKQGNSARSQPPHERPRLPTKPRLSRFGRYRARRWSIPYVALRDALSAIARPPPVSLARTGLKGRWL